MPNREVLRNARQFRGLNNVSPPERLSLRWAARADNVELDDRMTYWKRRGRVQVLSGDYTTAFSSLDKTRMYAQKNAVLYRVAADMTEYAVATLGSPAPLRTCEYNNEIFAANGTDRLVIAADHVRTWGLPIPAQPRVSRAPGSLPAGQYMVSATFLADDGRESGASPVVLIDLEDQSSILFQDIDRISGARTALYVSTHDGEVLYRVLSTRDTAAQWDGPGAGQGLSLRTQGLYPPPPGSVAEAHMGKIWLGQYVPEQDQSVIWTSEPLAFEHFRLDRGYIQVPGELRVLLSASNGLIIGTDRQVHMHTVDDRMVDVFEYGVPAGVPGAVTKRGQPVLWTHQGLARIGEGGLLTNVTEEAVSPEHGIGTDRVSVAVVDQDGYDKAVVVSEGADQG